MGGDGILVRRTRMVKGTKVKAGKVLQEKMMRGQLDTGRCFQ